jgi:Flp pilus assembly protein TadG
MDGDIPEHWKVVSLWSVITERAEKNASNSGPSGCRSGRRRGQSMVEFALVLPVFMLILAGILDFGFALYTRMTVINASRDGARAAVMVSDFSTIPSVATNAADSSAAGAGLTPSSVSATCLQTSASLVSPATISCANAQAGDSVYVTVNYTYKTFFPLLFGASLNLASSVQMVIE